MDNKKSKLDKKTIEALRVAKSKEEGGELYTEEEAKNILRMLRNRRPRIDDD
jgi:hypothetical protein